MKLFYKFTILLLLGLCMSGCMAKYAYYTDDEDKIEIIIDGIDGHDIVGTNPYSITKDDNTICVLEFIDNNTYDKHKSNAKNRYGYVLSNIVNDEDKGITYISYRDKNYNHNYLMKLNDSKYRVLLTTKYDKDKAESCYNKLNFIIED